MGIKMNCKVLVLIIVLMASGNSFAQDRLVISTFPDTNSNVAAKSLKIVREAYRKIGIEIEMRYLPGERAIGSANSGITDGELFRIEGMSEEYSNLVPVSVPICTAETVAYSVKDIEINGWGKSVSV